MALVEMKASGMWRWRCAHARVHFVRVTPGRDAMVRGVGISSTSVLSVSIR
jgi:hypothetical protein